MKSSKDERQSVPPVPAQSSAEVFAVAILREWDTIESLFQFAVGTAYTGALKRLQNAKQRYQEHK